MPASPSITTSLGRWLSSVAWNSSFSRRISRSRPVCGASRPSIRCTPPTVDRTARAACSRIGSDFPFRACVPVSVYAMDAADSERVVSSTQT